MSVRWISFLIIVALSGAITGNLLAQTDLNDLLKPKSAKGVTKPPTATVTVTGKPAGPSKVTLAVKVEVPEGYYIYGMNDDFGGRTRVQIDTPGLTPLGKEFTPDQPGKTGRDPDLDATVTKHYGTVTWTRDFQLPADLAGDGSFDVKGTVEGQYCGSQGQGGQCVQLRHPFWVTLLTGAATSSAGQYETVIQPSRKGLPTPDPVTYTIRLSPPDAAAGDTVTLSISAKLNEGWHTYSLTQSDVGGEPTEIDAATLRNLEAIDADFTPSAPPQKETGTMGNVLETYHDEVTWSRKFRSTGEKPGDYSVSGEISYQLCDAVRCLQVNVIPFAIGQMDAPAASPFAQVAGEEAPAAPSLFATTESEPSAPPAAAPVIAKAVPPPVAPEAAMLPFNLFILACIAGGFAALLTPCSYPMVPITVSFFLKQSEKEHKPPLLLALVYCGTIILAFTVIGVGLSYAFGKTFANDLANNSILNWIIGFVFVGFALNMLGAFEIRVPSFMLNWTASRGGSGGYVGAIFMALTFTLTSFTCTFAILGGIITQAANGELFRPVVGMLAFGTAFASPFFVLAMLPQLLKKMPKSGGWMNAVKVVMGLIELGAAVKFFSIADNPNPFLFDYATVMIIWSVISLAIGLYLFGFYRFEHDSPAGPIPLESGLLAMGFVGLAGLLGYLTLFPERATGLLMENIVSFAPANFGTPSVPIAATDHRPSPTDNQPVVEHHGLRFYMDYRYAFELARKEQRPVMVDFTGVNCTNCRKMEKVMARPENHQRLQKFVTAALYVDRIPKIQDPEVAAKMLEDNRNLEVELLKDPSMPNYAIVAPDGKTVLAAQYGYKEGNEFTEFLDEGWKNWQARERNAALTRELSPDHHFLVDLDYAKSIARSTQRPILINFTVLGDPSGRRMVHYLSDPAIERNAERFIPVQLFVDNMSHVTDRLMAERQTAANRATMKKFNVDFFFPSFLIVTPDGEQALLPDLSFASREQFTEFLDEGWKNWQARQQTAMR